MPPCCNSLRVYKTLSLFSSIDLLSAVASRRRKVSIGVMSPSYKSDTSRDAGTHVDAEDVPSRVLKTAADILKMYSTKSIEEQTAIIDSNYSDDAQFVDPLMAVKTPREINLAFLSLQKLFREVRVQQRSICLNSNPRLPSHISAASSQQFIVHNEQVYILDRNSFVARCLLPEVVDLEVKTFLTFCRESGRLLYHEDVWENNRFRFPQFLKPGNGLLSSLAFKAAGWGAEVDHAKFKGSKA